MPDMKHPVNQQRCVGYSYTKGGTATSYYVGEAEFSDGSVRSVYSITREGRNSSSFEISEWSERMPLGYPGEMPGEPESK